MKKAELRSEMLEKLNNLDDEFKTTASNLVISKLKDCKEYKNSEVVFTFVSFNNELNTHNFIKSSLMEGKKVLIPYVNSKERVMHATILENYDDLVEGHYGILTLPKEKLNLYEGVIDLVVTPGVIFDHNLYRIGYGAGYYDKFFTKNICTNKIGICYDFQLRDEIKVEEHDINLDKIITDKRIIERK